MYKSGLLPFTFFPTRQNCLLPVLFGSPSGLVRVLSGVKALGWPNERFKYGYEPDESRTWYEQEWDFPWPISPKYAYPAALIATEAHGAASSWLISRQGGRSSHYGGSNSPI